MSVNYATGLSHYEHKGKCGMAEKFDPDDVLAEKIATFVELLKSSKHAVAITGAGISTSVGIPDFRGPKGVWTLEEKGEALEASVTFETARPSYTHLALVALEEAGYLKYLISQNVDGLHLRSGFPRNRLSELHGDMFVEECDQCKVQYIRERTVPTMALKPTGNACTQVKKRGNCRGRLHDTILDWEDALPDRDLDLALEHCKKSDLCLCLGTSLQIIPCGNMPLATKRNNGKIVIVNLQTTKQDKHAHVKLHAYVDRVMKGVCEGLGVEISLWDSPKVKLRSTHTEPKTRLPKIVVDDCMVAKVEKKSIKRENQKVGSQEMNGCADDKKTVKQEIKDVINGIVKQDSMVVQNELKTESDIKIKKEENGDLNEQNDEIDAKRIKTS